MFANFQDACKDGQNGQPENTVPASRN